MTPAGRLATKLSAALGVGADAAPFPDEHEVSGWDDLRKARARVEDDVLECATSLLTKDVGRLTATLDAANPALVGTVAAFIGLHWTDEIGGRGSDPERVSRG